MTTPKQPRDEALLVIEERLVKCVEDLHDDWARAKERNADAPMPPHYVNALREAHKALLAGLQFDAKRGGAETSDPATLLLQLEQAKEAVRRRMRASERLAEVAKPRAPGQPSPGRPPTEPPDRTH